MAETEVDARLSPMAEDDLLAGTTVATTAAATAAAVAAAGATEPMLDAFPKPDLETVSDIAGEIGNRIGGEVAAAASGGGEVELDFDLGLDEMDDSLIAGSDEPDDATSVESSDDVGVAFEMDGASSVGTSLGVATSETMSSDAPDALSDDAVGMDFDLELDSQPMNTEDLVTDLHTASTLVDADSVDGGNGESRPPVVEVSNIAEMSEESDDDGEWDEAATKLDLAKAYIDMGDASGAKSIIEEVMKEGNAGQRKQAEELSAQLNA